MHLTNKIKAFTLSEMIVVLIVTSIVVGLAFSVLRLVQKQMYTIQQHHANNVELDRLETILWLDFNNYSTLTYNELSNSIKFSNAMDSVSYKFLDDKIIKKEDTFNVKWLSKKVYFEGEVCTKGYIDALKIETSKTYYERKLFIFKKNDATLFLN